MWQYRSADEIYHHGILGMKWGVRRYQNKNGSLTSAGKKRYTSKDYRRAQSLKKKGYKSMSNQELQEYNKRMELERKYKTFNPNTLKTGAAIVGSVAGFTASAITIKNNAPQILAMGKSAVQGVKKIKLPIK